MEISAKAEQIISQADQWTFAGDCALLQWMEAIGKNLEQRATATNTHFDKLSTNLKQTGTALDNVTNSLAALQYTQFVESRCHDDDETIANVTDVPLDESNQNDHQKDSDDIWQTFLKKNLEVLRNCHERYSLDLEDSDEEDATNNFVYQPKNPYNERLLPHIYGSKLWNENWHVGLCDDSNSYSGDDISEAFSETSSSPAEDNDSFASNSANLAEWASTTSITNEKSQQKQPIRMQNASSLLGSQPLFPSAQESLRNVVNVGDSETSSAVSTTATMGVKQNEPRFDIFAPVQDSPPPPLSSSSSASSLHHQQLKGAAQAKNNTLRDSANFITKPETVNPTLNSSYIPPIKRRPVNLFDDDDFSSFLTEIVDKSTAREAAVSHNSTTTPETSAKTYQKEQTIPSLIPNTQPIKINVQTQKKPPTLNLFDTPDSSPKKEDLFTKVKEVVEASVEENIVRHKLNTKTLFDDDDDDDFLAVFAAKKDNISKPISNLKLFDDDIEDDILQNTEDTAVPPMDKMTKIQASNEDKYLYRSSESFKQKNSSTKELNLFAEVTDKKYISEQQKENDLFTKKMQQPGNLFDKESATKSSTTVIQKKTDLFSSEDDDDLFKTTFEKVDKNSSKIIGEKVLDIKQINAELPEDFHRKLKDNIEPFEDVHKNDSILNKAEIKQDGSGDSSDNCTQKEKTIYQITEEIVKENNQIIHSNKAVLLEEVSNAPKKNPAPVDDQLKSTHSDLFLDEPPEDDSAFFQTLDSNVLAEHDVSTQHFEQDSYEPALPKIPTENKGVTAKVIPTSSYSNLGLFSDIPPDDDLEDLSIESANISSSEPKRIHSIFYDDFNETMEALNNRKSLETTPSLHSIFYDEPPPDDDFQALVENTAQFNEVKNTTSSKIFDNIQSLITKQESDKPDDKIITPPKNFAASKLKIPNININVQALLPGATQKSQLRKSVERDKELKSSSIPAKTNTSPAISPQTELKRDSGENILVNVCKHRVRAPAQRRPSTRRGRQESYRKSLFAEQEDELDIEKQKKEIEADAKFTQIEGKELPKAAAQSNKKVSKDIPRVNQAMKGTISSSASLTAQSKKKVIEDIPRTNQAMEGIISSAATGVLNSPASLGTQSLVADLFDEEKEKQHELDVKNTQEAIIKNKSGVLFVDDNDDYNFLFEAIKKNKTIEESTEIKSSSFLAEVDEGDMQENIQADNSQNTTSIPNTKISDVSLEVSAFDNISKSTDELTENIANGNKLIETPATNTESKMKTIVTKNVSVPGGLFDDDDENDFIFENRINNTRSSFPDSSKSEAQPTKVDDSESKRVQNSQLDIETDNKPTILPTPVKLIRDSKESEKKASSVNIFGDDDDDDDILFGSNTSQTQPQIVVKTPRSEMAADFIVEQKLSESKKESEEKLSKLVANPKVSSLFGSDEDENDKSDDDKFLNAMKNPAKLKTRLTKAAEREDSKALFSDTDDDDEDLFGSKATKATLPKSSQSNVTTVSKKPLLQTNKTTIAATTTDNPLADLLNN